MVEMIVAVVILAVAILGLSSSTSRLARTAVDAEKNALALQAVEDRMSRIRLHPIYQQLDSMFTESEAEVPSGSSSHQTDRAHRFAFCVFPEL